MANTKISALTSATTPLAGTEVLPIVQSSATVKVATNDLTVRNIRANATTGILQVTGPTAASTRVVTVPDANFTAARTDAGQTFTGNQIITGNVTAKNLSSYTQTKTVGIGATQNLFYANNFGTQASGFVTIRSNTTTGITVTTFVFNIMGNGIATGVVQLATEIYGGGGASFTVTETRNSPGAPQNQVAFTNTSGASTTMTATYQFISGYEDVTFI